MADEMMVKELEEVVVRFSGDSGDGMQLAGNIFSNVSATVGNDICTFPDYPAEAAEAFCRYPHIVLAFYGFRHLIRSADTVLHP